MPETMKPSLRLAATIATAVLTAGCAVAGISESTARSSAPVVTETTAAGDAVADETEESKPRAKPKPKPRPRPRPRQRQRSFPVARVVDGDTVELGNGQQVRVAGIDTPERGECGYEAASNHMADLVLFERVILTISDEGSSSPSP